MKKKKSIVGVIFEPLVFGWLILSGSLIWIKSKQFRKEVKRQYSKTGRSPLVILRYLSKKASYYEIPLYLPVFSMPGIMFRDINGFFVGAFLGWLMFVLIPVMFPMPSTLFETE